MNLEELRRAYPNYTIRQEPDPCCHACKGSGEIGPTSRGIKAPCLCVVLSEPHGESKTSVMKALGEAARRLREHDQ